MNNQPLCQFGPGGDFVRTWPAGSAPLAVGGETPPTSHRAVKAATDLGLQAPLVHLGPGPVQWQLAPADHTAGCESLSAVIRTLLKTVAYARRRAPLAPSGEAVLASGSAAAATLAMPDPCPPVLARSGQYALTGQTPPLENDYGNRDAQAAGDPAFHSRLSGPQRLFPDLAGDRRSVALDQGYRLRARRSPRKKAGAGSRPEKQGPLFAGQP
ncbi:MAG: hypothetical protein NTV86_10805 [Planctomycetota bacterium]|nr:hypothetical protein [Planctomycetota bacterium]